jgi:hypothetical protein
VADPLRAAADRDGVPDRVDAEAEVEKLGA